MVKELIWRLFTRDRKNSSDRFGEKSLSLEEWRDFKIQDYKKLTRDDDFEPESVTVVESGSRKTLIMVFPYFEKNPESRHVKTATYIEVFVEDELGYLGRATLQHLNMSGFDGDYSNLSWIEISEKRQKQGYGIDFYRELNKLSQEQWGIPLRSSFLANEHATPVWKKLQANGEAEQFTAPDGFSLYRFTTLSSQSSP